MKGLNSKEQLQSKRVSRFTAERDIIGLGNEIDSYKETFNEFLKVHEQLSEQAEDGAAVDENDAYLDDVQESYIKVLQSDNKVSDSVPDDPRRDSSKYMLYSYFKVYSGRAKATSGGRFAN